MKTQNKLMLAGLVAALVLGGCGKKASPSAAPVLLGDAPAVLAPEIPATGDATYGDPSVADPALTDPGQLQTDASTSIAEVTEPVASATPTPSATATPDPDAAAKQAAEKAAAAKKAEEEAAAAKKAEDEAKVKAAKDAEALLVRQTPKFSKAIGGTGMHSVGGLAVDGTKLYVVDSARTGLLGKFSAIRVYDIATGNFLKSIENIGWVGAKNLPTSVERVKLDGALILASDETTTWSFNADGELQQTVDGKLSLPTTASDPKFGGSYRIKDGQIERLNGPDTVLLKFGDDELESPKSIAVDNDGNIFVSDASTSTVVVFTAPEE